MVKVFTMKSYYRRRRYRRRYRRRWWRRRKWIPLNYLRLKCELTDIIIHPRDEAGRLQFFSRREEQFPWSVTWFDLFAQWSQWENIYNQWEWIKVLGVNIVTVTNTINTAQEIPPNIEMLGIFWGDDEDKLFDQVQMNNQTLLLDPSRAQVSYFRNPQKRWLSLQTWTENTWEGKGQIQLASQYNVTNVEGYAWSCRIQLHLAVKKSKI